MHVDTLPSLPREYWQALTHSKPGLAYEQAIPRITLEVAQLRLDAQALARYRQFADSTEAFPLAYAYVLAQPAHFHLINQPDFPVRCVGLVHSSHQARRLGDIDLSSPLQLRVTVTEDHVRRRGREFTLHTLLQQNGHAVIEMNSGYFTRVNGMPPNHAPRISDPPVSVTTPAELLADLHFPAHFGRSYARVSGDFNPIHLYDWLARPLGFRRAIAHGVGSMARIEAELSRRSNSSTQELNIRFRRPLELPGDTHLHRCAEDAAAFVLLDSNGRELLSGTRR